MVHIWANRPSTRTVQSQIGSSHTCSLGLPTACTKPSTGLNEMPSSVARPSRGRGVEDGGGHLPVVGPHRLEELLDDGDDCRFLGVGLGGRWGVGRVGAVRRAGAGAGEKQDDETGGGSGSSGSHGVSLSVWRACRNASVFNAEDSASNGETARLGGESHLGGRAWSKGAVPGFARCSRTGYNSHVAADPLCRSRRSSHGFAPRPPDAPSHRPGCGRDPRRVLPRPRPRLRRPRGLHGHRRRRGARCPSQLRLRHPQGLPDPGAGPLPPPAPPHHALGDGRTQVPLRDADLRRPPVDPPPHGLGERVQRTLLAHATSLLQTRGGAFRAAEPHQQSGSRKAVGAAGVRRRRTGPKLRLLPRVRRALERRSKPGPQPTTRGWSKKTSPGSWRGSTCLFPLTPSGTGRSTCTTFSTS